MDEDRIESIARAMCRAARLEPDAPRPQGHFTMMRDTPGTSTGLRNWTLFQRDAEAFVASHCGAATWRGIAAVPTDNDAEADNVAR